MVEDRLGYLSSKYAEAFSEFGSPVCLKESGSWILRRSILDTDYYDAMGLYPIMCCRDWTALASDLEGLHDIVSLVAVPDPFCSLHDEGLVKCGFDFAKPYKEHVILNPKSFAISKHHAYYAKKAMGQVNVEMCKNPLPYLSDWCRLYDELVERHQVTGLRAFSYGAFRTQFKTPGLAAFRAIASDETVGMHLWFEQGRFAYSHLAASSEVGYDLMAAYALHRVAIDYFRDKVEWLDLGAGTAISGKNDGLTWFKKGWSVETAPVYLCGKIFDRDTYKELNEKVHTKEKDYFPAYRAP